MDWSVLFTWSVVPRFCAVGTCTVVYPNLITAANNGVIGPSSQVVIPPAAFTGCGRITECSMLASCTSALNSVYLQVWTPDRERNLTYQLRSAELVSLGQSGCNLNSPIAFSNLQNLTFQPGDVLGMYVLPSNQQFLQPGIVRLNNDHRGALSDDIDHYLRVERSSVVEEVTFNAGAHRVTNTVPLISIQGESGGCMMWRLLM